MPTNYASSYSKQTIQAFTLASLTRGRLKGKATFSADSGKAVKVFTNGVATMNDYKRTGENRFGTPEDLGNSVQELICTRERSFSTVLDGVDGVDLGATQEAAAAFLRRQIDEVITPEIDAWTLSKMAAACTTGNANLVTGTVSATNAYSLFLDACTVLNNSNTPLTGRVAWVSAAFYKFIKQDEAFIKATDLAQDMLVRGQVGQVDGVAIVMAPDSYMPEGVSCIVAHGEAACQPIRLETYNIYDKCQGYSGPVVEGLVYYDAFVYDARVKSVAAIKTA